MKILNKMNINMMISGHQHDLYVFEPGLELSSSKLGRCKMTDHNFLNILVSKRGPSQFKTNPLTDYSNHIGMTTVVDFTNNIQTCVFNDSYGNKINIENELHQLLYFRLLIQLHLLFEIRILLLVTLEQLIQLQHLQ